MRICILDAWAPDDSALVNSHWVAEQNCHVLLAQSFQVAVEPDGFDREAVRMALAAPHDGFAFFGHGRDHVLFRRRDVAGKPIVLVGDAEIPLIGRRWFHAFACLSGKTLAFNASDAGVAAYLGYTIAVNVEWEPSQLPAEVVGILRELVTTATMQLALGERSATAIRRAVRDVAVRLRKAIAPHQDSLDPTQRMALAAFATCLHKDLALEGLDVRP